MDGDDLQFIERLEHFGFELALLFGELGHRGCRRISRDINTANGAFAFDYTKQIANLTNADVLSALNRDQHRRYLVFGLTRVGNAVDSFVSAFLFVDNGEVVKIYKGR